MQDGQTQLHDWIRRRLVNQREAARLLDMDWTTLNKILKGDRRPGLQIAIAIERVTGIAVEAWLPTEGGRSDQPTAADAVSSR